MRSCSYLLCLLFFSKVSRLQNLQAKRCTPHLYGHLREYHRRFDICNFVPRRPLIFHRITICLFRALRVPVNHPWTSYDALVFALLPLVRSIVTEAAFGVHSVPLSGPELQTKVIDASATIGDQPWCRPVYCVRWPAYLHHWRNMSSDPWTLYQSTSAEP